MLLCLPIVEGGEGFNPMNPDHFGIALWTWIILLIAIPFIWKAVMGPITRALSERDAKVVSAMEAAEKASAAAKESQLEVEKKLVEARTEAAKLVADARARAEIRERDLIATAERRAAELEEAARRSIGAERDKAIAQIREEVVDLSIQAAGRVIGRNVGSDDDRRMAREIVAQKR